MQFGDMSPTTLLVLNIILGVIFVGFAGVFFGQAWQNRHRYPLKAWRTSMLGVVVLASGIAAVYLLFS